MSFSIRLTDEERAIATSYAKLHALALGEAFKQALFEKIENEYDIAVADSAYDDYLKEPETYSHEEAKKLLEI